MSSVADFLKNFFKNKGQFVFVSLLVAKICAFITSLLIIRLLPQSEFGVLSIVLSVFAVFLPFSGFGTQQSLLRYGSVSEDTDEKKSLSRFLFFKGLFYQIVLGAVFLMVSFFFLEKYDDIFIIFLALCVRLFGFYFFGHMQSELRILGNNKEFAKLNNVVNILGLILVAVCTYYFGLKGYLLAIAVTPFIALFWFRKNHFATLKQNVPFSKKEMKSYGIHAAGTALLSDALFSADILLLGFLLNENAVANYKVAVLIPANITFLSLTFMQSDFPVLAKNYRDKSFLKNYTANYYKIFVPVCFLIFAVGFLLREQILHFFFSAEYSENTLAFTILLAAFLLNMLFRNLYGNLLSAVGKMKVNTVVSLTAIVTLVVASFFVVPIYGVVGMSFCMGGTMLLTGVLLFFVFARYLKDLK